MKIPNTPFSTRLSGSAKETELRLRSIFQWKKKRPPVVLFILTALVVVLCGSLIAFTSVGAGIPEGVDAADTLQLSDALVYAVEGDNNDFTLYWMVEGQEPEVFYEAGHWGRPNLSMEEVQMSGNCYLAVTYIDRYRDDGRILDKKYIEVFYIPDAGVPVYIHHAENVPYPAVRNKSIKEIVQYADANLSALLDEDGLKHGIDTSTPEKPDPEVSGEPIFSFADVQTHEFTFSSGAGAWYTHLFISEDGSFVGVYHDSEMGSMGEGYPNGTQYYSEFEGQFEQPAKVNEYTYSVRISSIRYANEVGTEEIKDGIRYIYSEAYGLQNADHVLIYLPGAPLEELPEGYRNWVGYHDLSMTEDTELPFYGLYNEAEQTGFSSYDLKSSLLSPAQPSIYAEGTQDVLNYVDAMFADGNVALWCYLLPGTGPISAPLDEYYEQVREVFAQYTWTKAEEAEPRRPHTSETWELWLVNNYVCQVDAWSNSNRVVFVFDAVDGSETAMGYSYDGEPGSLNYALANLWADPVFRYALVLLPVEGQDDRTLMEAYEKEFREMYLNSGAITDYELHELELIPTGEVIGGSQSPFFRLAYSVKPTDLSAPCWKNHTVGEDNWVDISVEVNLSLTGYENSEEVWRCGFWQY